MDTDSVRPAPGAVTQFRWRKWDAAVHWVHDCVYLGADQWGDWFGQPVGSRSIRPGREIVTTAANVTLMPPSGEFALTVNAAPATTRVYIDLGWDIGWSPTTPGVAVGVDMDLDVVKALDGRGIWIDDRDEWDEHRVAYGYPLELVTRLEALAVDLEERVRAGVAPFDDATAQRWLDRLAALADGADSGAATAAS